MNSATALRIVFAVVCCGLARRTVRATPNGFYCRGSAGNGNLHLKCVTTPCNGTACETVVDYVNEYGPDVSLDSKHKLLVNLDIDAIATIHVSTRPESERAERFGPITGRAHKPRSTHARRSPGVGHQLRPLLRTVAVPAHQTGHFQNEIGRAGRVAQVTFREREYCVRYVWRRPVGTTVQ